MINHKTRNGKTGPETIDTLFFSKGFPCHFIYGECANNSSGVVRCIFEAASGSHSLRRWYIPSIPSLLYSSASSSVLAVAAASTPNLFRDTMPIYTDRFLRRLQAARRAQECPLLLLCNLLYSHSQSNGSGADDVTHVMVDFTHLFRSLFAVPMSSPLYICINLRRQARRRPPRHRSRARELLPLAVGPRMIGISL